MGGMAALLAFTQASGRAALLVAHGGSARHAPTPPIAAGASDHLLQPTHSANSTPPLDKIFVNNWDQNPAAVNLFLQCPEARAIVTAIFGQNYRLISERFARQSGQTEPAGPLRETCHVDSPVWKKVDFSQPPPDEQPQVVSVPSRRATAASSSLTKPNHT